MADIPLTNGVGDIEYYFTADVNAPYYTAFDYAFDESTAVGFGAGWTEKIFAVTNRAEYGSAAPSGGSDYFVRVREGESGVEWAKIVGELTVTNAATGSNDVIEVVDKRLALVGDHLWRYHYAIPTNGVGATLKFRIVAKERYTNSTDSATWHVRTNTFYAADAEIPELPYTATLDASNPYEMKVVLDDSSTHLKIEYNDEQRAFAFSHASYQNFNLWADAMKGFVGNVMFTNGVSNSGVASDKLRYDAPFSTNGAPTPAGWALPTSAMFDSTYWREAFTVSAAEVADYPLNEWFSQHYTPESRWTARNGMFVQNDRNSKVNAALALDGRGEGLLVNDNFTDTELPLGIGTVAFNGRISQPADFGSFATYMDGLNLTNYAVSAKITMSQDYETASHRPADMSPVNPSVSLVGYHREKQGCYEFRMTRTADDSLTLGLYKWTKSGSSTKSSLLREVVGYKTSSANPNLLRPVSATERNNADWTAVYFLVYTLPNGSVRLEGHISASRSRNDISSELSGMGTSAIWYVDGNPGKLARGGTYGVGSTDCRAGFGWIRLHTSIPDAPTATTDAKISADASVSPMETVDRLSNEWDYYDARWTLGGPVLYSGSGCLMSVVPSNQTVKVKLMDAEVSGKGWEDFGYERIVDSFSTTSNFVISVQKPGVWRVQIQTGEEEDTGVVVDDVRLTPWEGLNVWGRDGTANVRYDDRWAYTKGWVVTNRIRLAAGVYSNATECLFQPSRGRDGYPMGLRSPYIAEGLSLFSYSYRNADTNCVMLVQIATNMTPREGSQYVRNLTTMAESDDSGLVWTTVARHDFSTVTDANERASGTRTTPISLRQHYIYDSFARATVLTNVCGLVRVIVDPEIVSKVAAVTSAAERVSMANYGSITLTEAHCYNEPALDLKSWFGWNVYSAGWDGESGASGRFAYLTDYPDGLSVALNFSAKTTDNNSAAALGVGLADDGSAGDYAMQNPFVQSAAFTNGIGSVSFRARLFNTNDTRAVITLYGGTDPGADQPTTESATWDVLTNFVVTSATYQPFEFALTQTESPYQAVRLSMAGARWGRYPSGQAEAWEWGEIEPKQEPVNRVLIDEMSASELIVPRLKFLDVRPFRTDLMGTGDPCVITNIASADQQPLVAESWGIQCRVEPQQMADDLNKDSIKVFMEAYRGPSPWGYEQWKDLAVDNKTRFSSQLARVGDTLVYRSHYTFPESIMPPEETANTVYQYVVRAEYSDNSKSNVTLTAELSSKDWTAPYWYRGSLVGAANASGDSAQFSAYTILDAISPRRAWVNEINYTEGSSYCRTNQFMELAVPQAADLKGWRIVATTRNQDVIDLAALGVDAGVKDVVSKQGERLGEDFTNHYTFVSICAPSSRAYGSYDGYWKSVSMSGISEGMLQYYEPYGIQLIRPSGIIEHEFVVEGTNVMAYSPSLAWRYSGTNLVATLRAADSSSQWFYAGEDPTEANTSLGVWKGHGEDAVPSTWTNYMYCTPGRINRLKDGTLQEIDAKYFLEPNGTNVWIYSYLADDYVKQFYGGTDMGKSAVIIVPQGTKTNIVVSVANWYQLGVCTTNDVQVAGASGATGTYTLDLGAVSNSPMTVMIGSEPQSALSEKWGLTADNRYTPAVISWLTGEYGEYGPEDLSAATFRDFAWNKVGAFTLTEMYWLNIPPVHAAPWHGGSNVWFMAGSGTPNWLPKTTSMFEFDTTTAAGKVITNNVYMTVTMMITNTVTGEAAPPDRLNGLAYDGNGSYGYDGSLVWTSVVFNAEGALLKPDVASDFLPLRQYVFTADSFAGKNDAAHPFQTRVKIMDPYLSDTMGHHYGWSGFRDLYNIGYRWSIKSNPDGRVSIAPLVADWTAPTNRVSAAATP